MVSEDLYAKVRHWNDAVWQAQMEENYYLQQGDQEQAYKARLEREHAQRERALCEHEIDRMRKEKL